MDFGVILRFLLKTLGAFAIIFVVAMVTPRLAMLVDGWIKKYRANHNPKKDETYGIRSIYELPPKQEDESAEPADAEDPLADLPPDIAKILREPPAEAVSSDAPAAEDEPAWEEEPEIVESFDEAFDDDEPFDDEEDFDDETPFDAEEEPIPALEPEPVPAAAPAQEESIPWFLR